MILAVCTDKEINTTVFFPVVLSSCIHVNTGSGIPHTSEWDWPLVAARLQRLPLAGRWYLSVTYSNLMHTHAGLFSFLFPLSLPQSGCQCLLTSTTALISECWSRITVAHLTAAAQKARKIARSTISWGDISQSVVAALCRSCRLPVPVSWPSFPYFHFQTLVGGQTGEGVGVGVDGEEWGGHRSTIVTGWKGSADVICPQWLFGKSNCGDIGGSIVWIFCLECPVCVVLRGGQEI